MKLKEEIKKIARRIINEELGINSQVSRAVDDIYNILVNEDTPLRNIPMGNNRHYPCKAANIDYPFVNGQTIRLNICIYDFPDNETLIKYKQEYPNEYRNIINAKTRQTDEWSKIVITGNMIKVNGVVDVNFYNWLQHELEHAFERIMSGKTELVKDTNKYTKNINSFKSENEYIKNAGRINYYSYPHEQNAFANGLYGVLKHSNVTKENIDSIINSTKYYAIITKLKKVVNDLSKLRGEERIKVDTSIKQEFGFGIDTSIKRGIKTIEDMLYKLGRVKVKVLEEL